MNDALTYLSYRKWLTLHEVACLVHETNPEDNWLPDGYSAMLSLLNEAVTQDLIALEKISDDISFDLDPIAFWHDDISIEQCEQIGIFFGSYLTRQHCSCMRDGKKIISVDSGVIVHVNELKRWFNSINLKPRFFFADSELTPKNNTISHSNYRTKRMDIIDRAIARYYGENFDISDKDSYPKQDQIIDWLRSEFSLSDIEARAIEKIITHRDNNYPNT